MLRPPEPEDEALRLKILKSLALLDTLPDPEVDILTQQAATLFDVPISLVSLVDSRRQWFKSKVGLTVNETPRDISFCAYAILNDDTLVITDASTDLRFHDNPLVVEEPFIRFYAGAPLKIKGHAIGTLCLIDCKPRSYSRNELKALRDIADKIENIFSLRLESESS